jgi:hypothetical protein
MIKILGTCKFSISISIQQNNRVFTQKLWKRVFTQKLWKRVFTQKLGDVDK